MGAFSLETVIRPFVTQPTRPTTPAAVLAPVPAEDADRNAFTLTGSGQVINLAHSARTSMSRSIQRETERTFDLMRVKNPEDNEQYVDVEAVRRLKTVDGDGIGNILKLAKAPPAENVELLEEKKKRVDAAGSGYGSVITP